MLPMFNYNFSIQRLIKQVRNPWVIMGNAVDYVHALLRPLEYMKQDLINFVSFTREKEQWTWQVMSMEKLLNNRYAVNAPTIQIETLNATKIVPLADRYYGESYLGSRTSSSGFLVPTKEEATAATGVRDHFVVYADEATIAANEAVIRQAIEYYKFAGLRYQLRRLNDVIPNEPLINNEDMNFDFN